MQTVVRTTDFHKTKNHECGNMYPKSSMGKTIDRPKSRNTSLRNP